MSNKSDLKSVQKFRRFKTTNQSQELHQRPYDSYSQCTSASEPEMNSEQFNGETLNFENIQQAKKSTCISHKEKPEQAKTSTRFLTQFAFARNTNRYLVRY